MGDDIAVSTTHVVPVGQPLTGASLGQATKRFFRGYFRFSGRASLSEFWWAMLAVWLISLVPLVPTMLLANTMNGWSQPGGAALLTPEEAQVTLYSFFGLVGASMLASVVMTIPTYAVMWRRVQDANFHGAWILISFLGLGIVPFIMCLLPSNPAGARFGPASAARTAPAFAAAFPSHESPYALRQQQFGTPDAYPAAQPYAAQHRTQPASPYGSAQAAQLGQPQYGSPQLGQPQYGARAYGGAAYGGTPYGQPEPGRQQDEWQA